jgi:3-methyl-2-oxobutanoate hydroxymethyltransferase
MKRDIRYFNDKKKNKIPISLLTAYDFPTAQILDEAGIDILLVGDSVGTNVLGYKDEREVSMADMLHHLGAVARGTKNAWVMVDMPYNSANDPFIACENARMLIEKGADCVKVEGWEEKKNVVAYLSGQGISVCAHIGYNPQIHGSRPKTFGKTTEQALDLINSAKVLEDSGAVMVIVEKVPQEITALISESLRIPVLGIGAGSKCDGQVLVINDIIGITPAVFKHTRKYMDFRSMVFKAATDYKNDIEKGCFPSEENVSHLSAESLEEVLKAMGRQIRV